MRFILFIILFAALDASSQNKGIFDTSQFNITISHDYGFINNVSWNTSSGSYELQRAYFSDYSDAVTVYSGSNLSYRDELGVISGYCYYRVRSNSGAWVNGSVLTTISDNTIDTRTEIVGNSITYGSNASPLTNGFAKMWWKAKGWTEPAAGEIIGLPGNSITPEAAPPTTLWTYRTGGNRMVDKIPELNFLVNGFGVNDGVTTPILSLATADQYATALNTWIDYCISVGWPTNRIIIMGPFLYTTNIPRLETFRDAAKAVCANRKVAFFSAMDWEISNSIVPADNVHLDNAQHKQFCYALCDRIENPGTPLTYATTNSIAVESPTVLVVTFNVPVEATNTGWTFNKNGGANNPTAISGSGTTKLRFTIPAIANGDIITYSYSQSTGDAASLQRNYSLEIPTVSDLSVTNNVPSSYDTDAQSIFTAVEGAGETLSDDEKAAYNTAVLSLKSNSLWTKVIGFWFLGGNLNKSKFNWKDPQDTDGAYRLTQTGTVTFSSDGATGTNSAGNYLNTNFNPSSNVAYRNDLCFFASQLTTGGGTKSIMCSATSAANGAYTLIPGGSTMYVQFNNSAGLLTKNNPSPKGRYYVSRTGSTGWKAYKYKQLMIDATASTSFASSNANICIAGGIYPTDQKVSYAGIASGLTESELFNLEDIMYRLEATLNRF
jgi:lysophospholipase L1-like esterase